MGRQIPVLPFAALGEGEMAAVRVDGRDLLIANVDGQFYAVDNRCPHAGARLDRGNLDGCDVQCPAHGAIFDVRTGAGVVAPEGARLGRVPVVLAGGKVCVEL